MIKFSYCVFALLFLYSCELKGVDSGSVENKTDIDKQLDTTKSLKDTNANELENDSSEKVKIKEEPSDTLTLQNGIRITYFKKGSGPKLKKGEMIKIDYRAKLEDGTVFDGNHLVKKKSIPYLVGWNQQTKGWDIALQELKVGDDVDIFLPAAYARGEKGIKGLVPPNANNIISLRIIERFEPTKVVDDIQIWKYDELDEPGDSIGFKDEVHLNYWVSSERKPRYDNNYMRGKPFKLIMGDGNIVPGLYKALHFGREGDRLMIKIPAKEAYGSEGLVNQVEPNEDIFYDIQIAKVIKSK
ncbi:hypothetical protein CW751_11320 [Brumimicrobium salinarum]|uniref:Peptidyl-prolyl cis-trans isomerase n=1 Tax=Brumimicrobium salinarum TaxID=2058658 RepID=A0A2I0R0G6_9FLAO|nr:FKBP-type peptidyl-prolyl cis-trans isomerase [Brumimicrobium salinarum]PKR80088.1 hypothetical protein CW751_11320 [Brumimicrobium salinarum]